MARPLRAVALCLVAAALVATPSATTYAASPAGPRVGSGASAAVGEVRAQITFTKRPGHPWDSRIEWQAWRRKPGGRWLTIVHDTWRAGSGFPGRDTTNACAKGRGWLPDGRYSLRQYDDYAGSLIHGRAFRLSDHRCSHGTLREQLFLHTEAGPGNTQCPDRPGDQICRWEFPRINDYTSHGCIKMSPADILALTRDYHRYFRAGVRYPTSRVSLLVR